MRLRLEEKCSVCNPERETVWFYLNGGKASIECDSCKTKMTVEKILKEIRAWEQLQAGSAEVE